MVVGEKRRVDFAVAQVLIGDGHILNRTPPNQQVEGICCGDEETYSVVVDPSGAPGGIVPCSILRVRDKAVSGQKRGMRSVPSISVRSGRGDYRNTAGINDIQNHLFLVSHKGLHDLDGAIRKRDGCGLGAIAKCLVLHQYRFFIIYNYHGIILCTHRSPITGGNTAAIIVSEFDDDVVSAYNLADQRSPKTFSDVRSRRTTATGQIRHWQRHVLCEGSSPSRWKASQQTSHSGRIGNTNPWMLVEDWAIVESPAIIIFADADAKRAVATADVLRIIEAFIGKYLLYDRQ